MPNIPNNPLNTTPGLPTGSLPGGPTAGIPGSDKINAQQQQLAFENALRGNADLAGIWDTIKNAGGDVWGIVSKVLPHNADGSINWGGLVGNVAGWIHDHKKDILDALSVYNSYSRQNKGDQLGQEAVDLAKQRYAAQEPLRVAGMAGMLDPTKNTPDLSALATAGQRGANLQAPIPLANSTMNFNNAQQIAGPRSGNPFAPKTAAPLPIARPPMPTIPPAGPVMPSKPGALPVAQPTTGGTTPGGAAPGTVTPVHPWANPPTGGQPTTQPVGRPNLNPNAPPNTEPVPPKRKIAPIDPLLYGALPVAGY